MKTKIILIIALNLLLLSVNAQEWMNSIKTENPTFFEIQDAFNDYWKNKPIEKGKGYKQFKRWEWFWEQRVSKSGEFPKANLVWDELEKYNNNHPKAKLSSATSGSVANWAFLGPNSSQSGYSGIGRINCIAFHPTNANTFWVGTPAGGLWKTTDGGQTWTTNTDNLPVLGVSDIAIDPTNPNTIYIATGDGDAAYGMQNGAGDTKSIGILKSTNGGSTWTSVLTTTVSQNVLIRRLIINPNNPQNLLAATSMGIWRTTNGGTNWSATTATNLWFMDIEFKPTDPNYVYAATRNTSGNAQIYTSTNNGVNWTQVTNFTNCVRINLAVSSNSAALVDAVCVNTSYGLRGLWYSLNSGASFTQYYTATCSNNMLHNSYDGSGCGGQGNYDLAYAINPQDGNEIWLGGVNTWRTVDGGSNWDLNNIWHSSLASVPEVHADKHFIAFHPLNNSKVYECNDGGLYLTTDGGFNWTDLSNGLGISQIYRLGTSATTPNMVICGLQDNGSKRLQSSNWDDVTGGDGMECIIDFTNSNTQYGTYVEGEIKKTTNNWSSDAIIVQNNGTGVDAPGAWVTPYIMHPTNSNILLVGKAEVFQTTNGGNTWSQLGSLPSASGDIIAMAYAPSNPSVIYVSTPYQLFKTINGGSTWSLIYNSSTRITYISVSQTNSQKLWITKSGYTFGDKVLQSTNGGSNWSNFSGTLPNLPVNCIVYQNGSSDGVYIGTDVGVYYRDATLSDWVFYNTGLPNVVVNELEISYNNNKLWAATYGRGLWNTDLYCSSPAMPSSIVGPNNFCVGATNVSYSVTLVAGAASYAWNLPNGWSGSSTSNIISPVTGNSGIISVLAVNACGASQQQSLAIIVNPVPNINIVATPSIICVGESSTLSATGANSYTWSSGATGDNIVIMPNTTTSFTVNGTDQNNCEGNYVITQIVDECAAIDKISKETDITTIYPNPFKDGIEIKFQNERIQLRMIQIFDVVGKLIFETKTNENQINIDLKSFSKGLYNLKISQENQMEVRTILKE